MRCAPSLQSLKVHFIFFGGMPPRMGSATCRVEERGRIADIGVVVLPDAAASVEVRCLPACTRRMSDVGAEVRRERSWRKVGIVVSEGTVRGMARAGVSFLWYTSVSWVRVTYCLQIAA